MYLENTQLLLLTLALVALLVVGCGGKQEPPPADPPPAEPLPRSLKGYELYSRRVGREWYFTLVTATNRLKTYEEVTAGESGVEDNWVQITVQGVHDAEATLEQLPPEVHVAWMGPRALRQSGVQAGDLALPPPRLVEEITSHCQEVGVRLEVIR
jgi:hypothetical protein